MRRQLVLTVGRLQLPDDAKMAKEVPLALVRASTVFISYLAALYAFVFLPRLHQISAEL